MTPKEIVLEAIAHHSTDVIPYTISVDPEAADRLDAHYGGRDKWPVRRTFFAGLGVNWRAGDAEGAEYFKDIFGVEWKQGNIFHITKPVLDSPSLAGYTFPTLVKDEELEGHRAHCEKHKDLFKDFTFGLLFWERAWALRGMENMLMDLAAEPAFADALFERLMELHLEGLDKILPLPFDGVRFGDDFGAQKGLIMGKPYWLKYLKPRLAKMYGKVRAAGKIVSIHSCGDNSEILGDLIDIGLQVFNPSQPEANDLAALKREFGRHITFEGGIGTQVTLPLGTPDEVRQEIRRCRQTLGKGGGLVMATTKPIRPDVPTANAVAAVETIIEEAEKGTP